MELMLLPFRTLAAAKRPTLLKWLVSAILFISLVTIAWQLIQGARNSSKAVVLASTSPNASSRVNVPSQYTVTHIANEHIFGTAAVSASAPAPAAASSSVHVIGILSADDPEHSWAILDFNGNQKMYAAGAALPDGETLLAVHEDRVVISGNGNTYSVLWDMHPADTNSKFETAGIGVTGATSYMSETAPPPTISPQGMQDSLRAQLLSRPRLPLPPRADKAAPPARPANPPSH